MRPSKRSRSRRSAGGVFAALAALLSVGLACGSSTGLDVPFAFEVVEVGAGAEETEVRAGVSGSSVEVTGTAFSPCIPGPPVDGELKGGNDKGLILRVFWAEPVTADNCVADAPAVHRYEATIGPLDAGTYTLEVRRPVLQEGTTWEEETVHTAELRVR